MSLPTHEITSGGPTEGALPNRPRTAPGDSFSSMFHTYDINLTAALITGGFKFQRPRSQARSKPLPLRFGVHLPGKDPDD